MKTVGNTSRGRSQGVMNIFRAPYRVHCAVIFVTAQLSCLAITIDQPRPKFDCVKQLYTPQLSVLFTVHMHCLLVTIRISITDLIGGTRGVSSSEPLRLGTFGCEKIVLIFTVKNVLKFENF